MTIVTRRSPGVDAGGAADRAARHRPHPARGPHFDSRSAPAVAYYPPCGGKAVLDRCRVLLAYTDAARLTKAARGWFGRTADHWRRYGVPWCDAAVVALEPVPWVLRTAAAKVARRLPPERRQVVLRLLSDVEHPLTKFPDVWPFPNEMLEDVLATLAAAQAVGSEYAAEHQGRVADAVGAAACSVRVALHGLTAVLAPDHLRGGEWRTRRRLAPCLTAVGTEGGAA